MERKVSDFVSCSRLIAKLVNECGYDGDTEFGTFLQGLEIFESADDVAALLSSASDDDFLQQISSSSIPADRILEIFDELAATKKIDTLFKKGIKLNRTSDTQIINHTLTDTINAYANGYRIICDSTMVIEGPPSRISTNHNVALNNGLPVTNIKTNSYTFSEMNIMSDRDLKEITQMCIRDYTTLTKSNNNLDKCINLQNLNISDAPHRTIIDFTPFAKTLEILYMSNCIRISDHELSQCVNLHTLYIDYLQQYTISSFPKNLRTLSIKYSQDIAVRYIDGEKIDHPDDIERLPSQQYSHFPRIDMSEVYDCKVPWKKMQYCTKIKRLCATDNTYITSCEPFHKSLKILDVAHHEIDKHTHCRLGDLQLQLCTNIKKLFASSNRLITTCEPFANTLKVLYADGIENNITDDGLNMCHKLTKVNLSNNRHVTTCAPFAKSLKILIIRGHDGKIYDNGLVLCHRIKQLNISENRNITTCEPFAGTLEVLNVTTMFRQYCGSRVCSSMLYDSGLKSCTNIKHLAINGNLNITSCAPFAKSLETLIAPWSAITDEGLSQCTNIKRLVIDNTSVKSLAPFANSLIELSLTMSDDSPDMSQEIMMCKKLQNLHFHASRNYPYADKNSALSASIATFNNVDYDVFFDDVVDMGFED